MKNKTAASSRWQSGLTAVIILTAVLVVLFWRSFLPGYVHFSNDGPLGQINVAFAKMPASFTGLWDDLNDTGYSAGLASPSISAILTWVLGPVGYAKFLAPIAMFFVGLGAWSFFRALKLSAPAAVLGALAAMLNTAYFATACWGVASQEIALGMVFFALALIASNAAETPPSVRWARLALAGLCVGLNVMDAADIGVLYSVFVAGFAFIKALLEQNGNAVAKAARGVIRVAVIAVFAGFIAAQTIISLIGTSVVGVAGTAQDAATKAARWDFATQWSLPKKETLGLIVPGLFGYKLDTPNGMAPEFKKYFEGGNYWGGMGRDPRNDRYFDSGGQDNPPVPGWMRQTGGGNYAGILVLLVGAWAAAQAFRRENSPFTATQKKFMWFYVLVALLAVPVAWGRFAPGSQTSDGCLFFALLYKLPYFSTARNPTKFLSLFYLAMVILFAYGVHALNRQPEGNAPKTSGPFAQLKSWWARAAKFDRRWVFTCLGAFGASVAGWLVFASRQPAFIQYLQKVGFGDENFARQIAGFSLDQAGWFLILFAVAIALVTLAMANYFSGPRAKLGVVLLGAFLIFDLGRADLPYIIHWDYKQKYDLDPANSANSINPIINFLRDKPYEHRVAGLPFDAQQQLRGYDYLFGGNGVYRIEWAQHHFPYFNIQSLDLIQMPRMPEDLKAYLEALSPQSQSELALFRRHWELTNTRYLLGAAGFLDTLNQALDPAQQRFRIAQRFDLVPKPGVLQPAGLEDLTAMPSSDGELAVFDFTGALPRAKLYGNWQVNTNDTENLKTLADLNFDPAKTVLISTPPKDLPVISTNENSGTVEFQSYAPKKIIFNATATAPSVLLFNDKYDPHWRVTVDGRPAQLLRCNFFMRGVQLPSGAHTVEFDYSLPNKPLDITLAAIGTGVLLGGFLLLAGRRSKTAG